MTHTATVIYEDGVLRLKEPLPEPSGTEFEAVLTKKKRNPQEVLRILLEIAALPGNDPKDGFSGAQHDEVLYGKGGK